MTTKNDIEILGYTNVNGQIIGLDEFYEAFFGSEQYLTWYRMLVVIQERDPHLEEDHRGLFKPMMDDFFDDFCQVLDDEIANQLEEEVDEARTRLAERYGIC